MRLLRTNLRARQRRRNRPGAAGGEVESESVGVTEEELEEEEEVVVCGRERSAVTHWNTVAREVLNESVRKRCSKNCISVS